MTINFGKFKGQDLNDVVKTAEGRSWMKWVISQPLTDNKYRAANEKRNAEWLKLISLNENPEVAKVASTFGGTVVDVKDNVGTTMIANQEKIIALLEELVSNTATIETKTNTEPLEKVAWDE